MKDSKPAYHRHDISDETWTLLEPHLPRRKGVWGGIAKDNRRFIDAVFWILRTGAPWRDLPLEYGGGATRTAVSYAGGTRVSGRSCWRF
jgi:transposase